MRVGEVTVQEHRAFEQLLASRFDKRVLRVVADHWLVETAAGCAFRQRMRFEGLMGEITGRVWRSLVNRYMEIEANGLKTISEETLRGE